MERKEIDQHFAGMNRSGASGLNMSARAGRSGLSHRLTITKLRSTSAGDVIATMLLHDHYLAAVAASPVLFFCQSESSEIVPGALVGRKSLNRKRIQVSRIYCRPGFRSFSRG